MANFFARLLMMFFGLLRQGRGRSMSWRPRRRRGEEPALRVYRDEPPDRDDSDDGPEEPAPVPASPKVDEHLEAQLDAVLAKVAAQGQGSLTSAEREILKRASEVYRKRRR